MMRVVYVGDDPLVVKRFFIDTKVVNKRLIKKYERLAKQGKVLLIIESPYDRYLTDKFDKSAIKGNIAVAKNKVDLIKILAYLYKGGRHVKTSS